VDGSQDLFKYIENRIFKLHCSSNWPKERQSEIVKYNKLKSVGKAGILLGSGYIYGHVDFGYVIQSCRLFEYVWQLLIFNSGKHQF